MPRRLTQSEVERFLAGRRVAVLVTIGEDGRPLPTPIWYVYHDGLLYFRTADGAAKARNARRDPRVSVCVQDERPPYRAVVVHGTAEVREPLEWLSRELPRRYLGAIGAIGYRVTAEAAVQGGRPDVVLVVRPERIVSFDYGSETPWFGKLWLLVKRVLPPWI
jgi:PPOX class probable F420-dependent enzyme